MFFFSLLGPGLMFFAATVNSPRVPQGDSIDSGGYFLDVRRLFLSVFIAVTVLFSLDGPIFGTEQALNRLRIVQLFVAGIPLWGILSAEGACSSSILSLSWSR